ncbi:hypothetical protein [Pelagibaculum spongiae]|uniref:Uncharacterized protein n=1 Tax=Pelagibaculum spongiae TaxID=2080658 RepID=A0A2V1GWS6_9GAMM|nr:hypothetical protein [Pelagibaculum spongiae]PVZ65646.1 hypothetical protein DC094_17315 [Pelagibaculum spongiae]
MPNLNHRTSSPRSLLKKRQTKVRLRRHQMQFFSLKKRHYIEAVVESSAKPVVEATAELSNEATTATLDNQALCPDQLVG